MSRAHGRSGQLYVGIASSTAAAEALPFTTKWSMNAATDKEDATAMGDTNKVYVSGLPDASGSFEGFYDDATAQTFTAAADGVARRFYLYPKTPTTAGPYWFGTGIFDFSIEVSVGATDRVSGSWAAATAVSKVG